jgi:hypothetical protein
VRRLLADSVEASPSVLSFALGFDGSSSRILRRSSSKPALRNSLGSNGRAPASSSYSNAPSEYTSVRVSTASAVISACSGLMYAGVPIICPRSV